MILDNENNKNVKAFGDIVTGDYYYKDPNYVLGYGPPRKEGVYSSIKLVEEDTVYSVRYTIKDKMRFTPNSNYYSNKTSIFLGCSQTFGEGLNDNQTLPYYYNEMFEDKHATSKQNELKAKILSEKLQRD